MFLWDSETILYKANEMAINKNRKAPDIERGGYCGDKNIIKSEVKEPRANITEMLRDDIFLSLLKIFMG